MTASDKIRVRLSTKGQVVLPKLVRARRNWEAGASLIVEETPDGVLLKEAPLFDCTRIDEVFGMLAYRGQPVTIEEMDASILREARRRHARD